MATRKCLALIGLLAAVLFLPARADALLLTVDDALLLQGETVDVEATLTWEAGDPDPLDLLGLNITLAAGPGVTADDSPFFTTWPLFLTSGGSFTGVLFRLTADPAAALGTTIGSATIFASGVVADLEVPVEATDDFSVTVGPDQTVIPEPASLLLLGSGLVGATLARRRRRS